MRIPRTAWYSQDDIPTALASMIGTSRLQRVAPEVQRIGLGLGLLYDVTSLSSNETKGWLHNRLGKSRVTDKELLKQWFSSFPDSFDSVVRFNTNQSALVFEPARGELRRLERFLVTCRSFATVMPTMFGIESMESAEAQLHVETLARWAWGIVLSRTGVARVKEATGAERDLVLLLPGVSLVNTAMDDWNLQLLRVGHLMAGEELTMDYGLKSNLQFLVFGGFTIPGNELGYPMRMNLTARMGKDMPSESGSEAQSWDSGELEHPPSQLSSQDERALRTIITNLQERVEEITRSLASVDIPAMEADKDPLSAKLVGVVRQELNAAIAWREKAEAVMLSSRR
ncbi:hypothetical protein Pmar_PMAR017349 [Perkinsus marinus ATCC 50983]|uniref:Rubisco LSMT substrate-binding domain-containing protein n=1 Tax=Perkinsus marinus (strain ATCC 50983 / TXsc) TaxID=423536 RepID=C5LHC6_PERM5|nr:hypothetical protein Pmar_PMAR017349 [Perkinsus marinus ATCC 50983]EER03935.1 hypothetical protein Pmar_PMAR017349 [Perkinsus marinus ATCC 50983]|eukprot:XP_002772119.1 hypothetical protein Pmar_PMAR017349 [Perkinsus marinus ATCC 50983]